MDFSTLPSMPKESLFHLTFKLLYSYIRIKNRFWINCIKLEQLYMRNSQIKSVSSKFETWGLEKANLKVIDLSENRKMDKNSAPSLVVDQLLTRSKSSPVFAP